MDRERDLDLIAVGAGSASFAAAIRASTLGARVALVERGAIGGTCVNTGCVPSKHLLATGAAYHGAGHHPFAGIRTEQRGTDLAAAVAGKDEVVSLLRGRKYEDVAEEYGFEIVRGEATFTDLETLSIDGAAMRADHYLVATGASPRVPPISGLEDAGYLTSTSAMELDRLPSSLAVIGGNSIGLEMGQLFSRLGSRVTVFEALDRLAPQEEPEISAWIERVFRDEGIDVVTSASIERVERVGADARAISLADGGRVEVEQVLVATGRQPNVDGLGLDVADVGVTDAGTIEVDEHLRTSNPRIFAAGDVTGAPQFVYVAAAQGSLAADNALTGRRGTLDMTALPRVIFTAPQIAAAGLTDEEANRQGSTCECRVVELEHVPRAIVQRETRGAFKIVAERESGRVLGVHAIADHAGDVILAAIYAIRAGMTVTELADTWAPYLTMAEGLKLTAQSFSTDVRLLSCCAA